MSKSKKPTDKGLKGVPIPESSALAAARQAAMMPDAVSAAEAAMENYDAIIPVSAAQAAHNAAKSVHATSAAAAAINAADSSRLNAAPKSSPRRITSAADLGAKVRRARKAMDMTQQEFADLAGVGRRFISELEGGKPTLEFDRVLKVCQAAGIDIFAKPRGS